MKTKKKQSEILIFIFLLFILMFFFFLNIIKYWNYTIDDAFISFRYSKNFATGFGLNWNYDNSYTNNGYTSLLWVIIISPFTLFRNIFIITKIINIIFSIFLLISLYFSLRINLTGNLKKISILFMIPLFFSKKFAIHINGGMETIFFSFLVVFSYLLWNYSNKIRKTKEIYQNEKDNINLNKFEKFTYLIIGLLAITRPEGILLALGYFFYDSISFIINYNKKTLFFFLRSCYRIHF